LFPAALDFLSGMRPPLRVASRIALGNSGSFDRWV
jgi:hypothetical protein